MEVIQESELTKAALFFFLILKISLKKWKNISKIIQQNGFGFIDGGNYVMAEIIDFSDIRTFAHNKAT